MIHKIKLLFENLKEEYKMRDVSLWFFVEESKRGAYCDIEKREIKVNTVQMERCNVGEMKEILIHEFAHMSFGKKAYTVKHNKKFGKRVRTMGGFLTGTGITLELK